MSFEIILAGMWTAFGVASGFFYIVKKKLVLGSIIGACMTYGTTAFIGVSFPWFNTYLNDLLNWVKSLGWGGLGYPIGVIVGKEIGRLWPE